MSDSFERIDLSDGTVLLRGQTRAGQHYTLTGDVERVCIETPHHDAPGHTLRTPVPSSTYTLKFNIKENGEAYRVRLDTEDVHHVAYVTVPDVTVPHIETARVLAGAPPSAQFAINDEPDTIRVCFTWCDTLVTPPTHKENT